MSETIDYNWKLKQQDKETNLRVLMMLSALESWSFSTGKTLPDYLHDELSSLVGLLEAKVLE